MARFNQNQTFLPPAPDVVNKAGGQAYSQTSELELVSVLLTSFASDSFYEKSSETFERLKKLIGLCDKQFVAQAAVYARREFGMRSITHVVAAELAKYIGGVSWAKQFYAAIVYRPDDMSEIIAYYQANCAKKSTKSKRGVTTIPNAMKEGFAKAFTNFNAYSLAKYKGEGKSVKLVDIANMVHPVPVDSNGFVPVSGKDYWAAISKSERAKLIDGTASLSQVDDSKKLKELTTKAGQKKYWASMADKEKHEWKSVKTSYWNISALSALMLNLLSPPETWEVELTKVGQIAESQEEKEDMKKDVWVKLLTEKKLRYLALLRNLRNIIEQAPEAVNEACAQLVDEKEIKKSLVFPFQYAMAYEQIGQLNSSAARNVLMALTKAVDISCSNVPKFGGETLVVLDTSGSMEEPCNDRAKNTPAKVGALFAAIMVKSNNADFMRFSDDASYLTMNPMDSTLTLAANVRFVTGGTDFDAIFKTANKKYDRIIILSDMQGWVGGNAPTAAFESYKKATGANPFIYSFDLKNYGSVQFAGKRVLALAGYSDKVFDIMQLLEKDPNALVNTIRAYSFMPVENVKVVAVGSTGQGKTVSGKRR